MRKHSENFFGMEWPEREYDITRLPYEFRFETKEQCRKTNAHRTNVLKNNANVDYYYENEKQKYYDIEARPSIINATWMRKFRVLISGQVLKIIKAQGLAKKLKLVTLINKHWFVDVGKLNTISSASIQRSFANHCASVGIDERNFMMAGIHGELNSLKTRYCLHYHVLCDSDAANKLEQLRGKLGYKSGGRKQAIRMLQLMYRGKEGEKGKKEKEREKKELKKCNPAVPIFVSTVKNKSKTRLKKKAFVNPAPSLDLVKTTTYVFQKEWNVRGSDGRKEKRGMRLEQEREVLFWLDEQDMANMVTLRPNLLLKKVREQVENI